jgi:hypothetical protein
MSYVYIRTETELWTVGHYSPDGTWHTDSDHGDKETAAERVMQLNGDGPTAKLEDTVSELQTRIDGLEDRLADLEGEISTE